MDSMDKNQIKQRKITFVKKSHQIKFGGMLAAIWFRNSSLPISCFLTGLLNNIVSNDIVSADVRMINGCGTIGGTRTGTGNQSTQRRSAPVILCSSQIPDDLAWYQMWTTVVVSRQLTT
jgi:hypothetical protein